jgi:hypothetical protein
MEDWRLTDRIPKPGEIYRHFKNKLYQIITVAVHTETLEDMVVYQALYGNYKTYVRPLTMFVSEVDKNKYPNVKQKYRFELITLEEENSEDKYAQNDFTELQNKEIKNDVKETKEYQAEEFKSEKLVEQEKDKYTDNTSTGEKVNSILLDFLDANTYEEKLMILTGKKKYMNDKLLNDMAVSLDCTIEEGELDQRINSLIFCLQTLARFENRRLR